MNFISRLMPREGRFFSLFDGHAKLVVDGALALERTFAGDPLDFFVLFTSVAGVIPSRGAGNAHYASANGYLDFLASHRHREGRSSHLSIAWVYWGETGSAAGEDLRAKLAAATRAAAQNQQQSMRKPEPQDQRGPGSHQHHHVLHEHPHDLPRLRPEREPDAHLGRPRRDRRRHHAVEADRGKEQRQRSERGQQDGGRDDAMEGRGDGQRHRCRAPGLRRRAEELPPKSVT